ncbi:GFA family protein [Robbsia andropogonis]|uniref:GFA family protein n=1 Tax=Robbsia andropogonis TaxID=28092 RepID=UPI0009DE31BA|nr:GFA family protein [Robbsia andropogonis]
MIDLGWTRDLNCHCQSCRDFYSTPMLSATAWSPEQVLVQAGRPTTFSHPDRQLSRTFCVGCGETMFGTNRLGMRVVPNNLIAQGANGELQEEMRPTMHLFYRSRIIDVEDDLTKYLEGWDGPTTTGNLTGS